LHGVVPEEFEMHSDRINAMLYGANEREIVKDASFVVCVSKEMQRHVVSKYSAPIQKLLFCPIFNRAERHGEAAGRKDGADRPKLIYAGGTQVWQRIPEMARLIAAVHDRMDYVCLTPDPVGFRSRLREAGIPEWEQQRKVYSATHAEVLAEYNRAHYGLLLRQDSVVNRVSCPTKLIEYLAYGVVPILESEKVGDFVALGMRFLKAEDVEKGIIPHESERLAMAEANFAVIDLLTQQSRVGLAELEKVFHACL
jgi:hypothetical protein